MVATLTRFDFPRSCLLACAIVAAPAQAAEVRVPDDFGTIQGAINAAGVGDEIVIEAGTYLGNLILKSDITLRGEETARTILRSTTTAPVMQLTGLNDITIRNLTFSEGSIGIEVAANSININILNNVFNLDTVASSIAIHADASTEDVEVLHNTFHNNGIAIERGDDDTVIKNNIFSSNNTAVVDDGVGSFNISFNCFAAGETQIGGDITSGAVLFVDRDSLDFHLQSGSVCINAGDPGDADDWFNATDPDAGAYGGPVADAKPFPVGRPDADADESVTNPGLFDVALSWEKNLSYLMTGYEIHYDSDESGPDYDGNDAQDAASGGAALASPFTVDDSNSSVTLFNLLSAPTVPDAPELLGVAPSNHTLDLRWSAVDGATGYRIEYGIAAVDEHERETGNVTEYALSGLENGQTYLVRVSALRQTRYYFALRAVGTPATETSTLSTERSVAVGPEQASVPSNERSGMPEPIEPYPLLPDQGDPSCFIATAAFGHFSHPQVQLLRDFRDRYLLTNLPGRAFVRWYYSHSPVAAAFIAQHDTLRMLVRWALLPLIAAAWLLLHAPALTLVLLLSILFMVLAATRMKLIRWNREYVDP